MEINIPCPHCHKSFSVQIDQIGPGKVASCPNCAAIVKFSGQDLSRVQQTITQLTNQLGNAAVKVNIKTRVRRPWWKFWGR